MRLPEFPATCTLTPVDRLDRADFPGGVLAPSDLLSTVREALRDRYAVAGEIGRGGMAVVCRATDLRHGREVAIKVLLPELARAVTGDRFLREISILARLSHPNILPLLDSGSVEVVPGLDVPWYVMPYVAEDTLRARLEREGPLPVEQALHLTRELCDALAHAHRQGIIHRDIKPENILLSGGRAVLADFGIARAVTLSGTTSLSSTGLVIGTPAYMSPEQSAGSEKLDARSDLYSLGVVLYEMLAGQPPFTGATPQAISARHQFETPPPIRVVRPTIPVGIEAVLARVLEKVPADRYEGAEALARAVEGAGTGALPVDRITLTGIRAARRRALRRAVVTVGVLVGLAAVVMGGWAWNRQRGIDPEVVLVLPFQQEGATRESVLSGEGSAAMVYDALARWGELRQVDPLRVQDAIARQGPPTTLTQAENLARWLGAGRLIWGRVLEVGDSTRVHGMLYRIGGFGSTTVASRVRTLPGPRLLEAGGRLAMAEVVRGFLSLARSLAAPMSPDSLGGDEVLATDSYDALRAYIAGDSALRAWDLAQARAGFKRALSFDPAYPQANLALAQLGQWEGDSAGAWQPFLDAARRGAERMTARQSALTEALSAIAQGTYPDACVIYRAMIARDDADFTAWYGLGECLSGDEIVVEDPRSPSGVSFRSSYQEALRAYHKALTLLPSVHDAFAGQAIARLLDRYFVEPNRIRPGRRWPREASAYGAFPVLKADTVGFVPRPIGELFAGRWPAERDLRASALSRAGLLEVTRQWIRDFPRSLAAWRSHAIALELGGALDGGTDSTAAALAAFEYARSLPSGADEALDLEVCQIRVYVKLKRFRQAAALADSALALRSPGASVSARQLAGIAALLGRTDRAAALAELADEEGTFYTPPGRRVVAPGPIAAEARRLLVYAAALQPESTVHIARRLRRLVGSIGDSATAQLLLASTLDQSVVIAFPILGAPEGDGNLRAIERAVAAGDTKAVQAGFAALKELRGVQRPGDRTLDIAWLEARLRMMIGDTAAAVAELQSAMDGLPAAGLDLVTELPQSSSLRSILRLLSVSGPSTNGQRERYRADLNALY